MILDVELSIERTSDVNCSIQIVIDEQVMIKRIHDKITDIIRVSDFEVEL